MGRARRVVGGVAVSVILTAGLTVASSGPVALLQPGSSPTRAPRSRRRSSLAPSRACAPARCARTSSSSPTIGSKADCPGRAGYDLAARYVADPARADRPEAGGRQRHLLSKRAAGREPPDRGHALPSARIGRPPRLLTARDDFFMVGDLLRTRGRVEAPVVFAGYGIIAPELQHDDYAGPRRPRQDRRAPHQCAGARFPANSAPTTPIDASRRRSRRHTARSACSSSAPPTTSGGRRGRGSA